MQKDVSFYNQFFSCFGPAVHSDPLRFSEIAKLCKGRVLDIGCGTGDLSDFYRGLYTGVDISSVAIDHAKSLRRKDASFLVADVLKGLDSSLGSFDTIVLAEFLEHIEKDEGLFEMLKNFLGEGGRLVISVPNGDRVPDESHVRIFTVPELRKKFSHFGHVKFHRWAGFDKRILMSCDVGQKSETSLSLAVIAKNEAKGLENCILSCIDFVDSVAVSVDRASIDDTFYVAERYADVLVDYVWKDDFSLARNTLRDWIETEWILWVDGHEFVREVPDLVEFLKNDTDGFFVRMELENGFTFYFPRLVRQSVSWKYAVHNSVEVKKPLRLEGLTIVHDRDNLQAKEAIAIRDKQRSDMIKRLLTEEIKRGPRSSRPYFYLAQQAFADRDFKAAVRYYKKYLRRSKHKGERWLVCYEIAYSYALRDKYLFSVCWLHNANRELPGRWEISKMFGIVYAMAGWYKKAAKYLVDSFKENPGVFSYGPLARNDAETWDFIGFCFYCSGDLYQARVAWKRALELCKNSDVSDVLNDRIKKLSLLVE